MAQRNPEADLLRLVELRRATAPLREEIDRLREELLDSNYRHNKSLRELQAEHLSQLASVATATQATHAKPSAKQSKYSVAEAIQKYLGKGMKPRSRTRFRPLLATFEKFVGPATNLAEVTQARYSEYADSVNAAEGWSIATKKLYITAAGTMIRWHANRGEPVESISAGSLILAKTQPTSWERDAFTMPELGVIFGYVAHTYESEPHWFWAVVATAFLGCRIEELAQADTESDFKKDAATGRWFIDINETIGSGAHKKSVKKESGWRTVPFHLELIRLGFLKFLERERKAGARTLFERAWAPHKQDEAATFNFSHGITKRGSRTIARLVKHGDLPPGRATFFHSLRHTFISHLAAQGVPVEMRCAIAGHKPEGGINASRYSKLRAQVEPKLASIDAGFDEYVKLLRVAVAASTGRRPRRTPKPAS